MKNQNLLFCAAATAVLALFLTSPAHAGGKYSISGQNVTASSHDGNAPANTVDGSLSTRWSASGLGEWIRFDLGVAKVVTQVRIAFHKGDERAALFDIQTSNNGSAWTTVTGCTSSGATIGLETFDFNPTTARYVRIVGYGNTSNLWNSYTEVEIWGPAKLTVTGASVAASSHDGNVPANAVDGSLSTRWSASGLGEWIRFDLRSARVAAFVKIAFYKGNERQSYFDIQAADSTSGPWITLASHTSSGTTTALETFDFPDTTARYIRIVGQGNSSNLWNSYAEVEVWGYEQFGGKFHVPAGSVTASSSNSNLPAYAVDGDLGTRWSANGVPEWLKLDLGAAGSINQVKIAFLLGDAREYYFDIDVSTNNSTWTRVLSDQTSSGTTIGLETFRFPTINARYVRITGYGNSVNLFNNYAEVEVWGYPVRDLTWIYDSKAALAQDITIAKNGTHPQDPVLFSSGASSVQSHSVVNGWLEVESGGGNGRVYWNYHELPEFAALPESGFNTVMTGTFKLTSGIENLSIKDGNHGTNGWVLDGTLVFGGFGLSVQRTRVQSKVEYWHGRNGSNVTSNYPDGLELVNNKEYRYFVTYRVKPSAQEVVLNVWLDFGSHGWVKVMNNRTWGQSGWDPGSVPAGNDKAQILQGPSYIKRHHLWTRANGSGVLPIKDVRIGVMDFLP